MMPSDQTARSEKTSAARQQRSLIVIQLPATFFARNIL